MLILNRHLAPMYLACMLLFSSTTCHAEESSQRALLKNSIDRAIVWLQHAAGENWQPDTAAMTQYLARKFPLPDLQALNSLNQKGFNPNRAPVASFPPVFYRLINGRQSIQAGEIAALTHPISLTTARALHCNRYPLPADFIGDLDKLALAGGYHLSHAVLAAQWSLENHCVEAASVQAWLPTVFPRLLLQIDAADQPADLQIESMAMLLYVDAVDRVDPRWISSLVASQRPDGGWLPEKSWTHAHQHTTFLALWVLLETLYPNAPDVPMIAGIE